MRLILNFWRYSLCWDFFYIYHCLCGHFVELNNRHNFTQFRHSKFWHQRTVACMFIRFGINCLYIAIGILTSNPFKRFETMFTGATYPRMPHSHDCHILFKLPHVEFHRPQPGEPTYPWVWNLIESVVYKVYVYPLWTRSPSLFLSCFKFPTLPKISSHSDSRNWW